MVILSGISCTVIKDHPVPAGQLPKGDYELILLIDKTIGRAAPNEISAFHTINEWIWLGGSGDNLIVQVKYRHITPEQLAYLLQRLTTIPGVIIQETRMLHM